MDIHTPENVTVVDSYSLANPFERILAALIDMITYGAIYTVLYRAFGLLGLSWIGGLLAVFYLLLRDSLKIFGYQSIGKKVMKIRVIRSSEKVRITALKSLKRNFIFLPNLVHAFGPSYVYAAFTVTFILILLEMYLMYTNADHQRLGDQFADTIVIEKNL
jgi:uncharacterized RDD family membrane protein YckC